MDCPRLALVQLSRGFPGIQALQAVELTLAAGEIHALVGENGAGKSTLIRVVAGILAPDQGLVQLDGHPLPPGDPVAARRAGIVTVFQEAEFFPSLSVAENMALPSGLPVNRWGAVDWPGVQRFARQAMAATGEAIDIRRSAAHLSVAQRQLIQVAAAVVQQARLLILDEPTSALSDREASWLFAQIRRLQQAGAAVLYVSHRQDEVFELASRITVLRDGRCVWTGRTAETDRAQVVRQMVGRTATPTATEPGGEWGHVEGPIEPAERLRVTGATDAAGRFTDIDLHLPAGRIVGLYGLVGAGRTELAHAVFGLRRLAAGKISVDGTVCSIRSPQEAVAARIAYVPEDRLRDAVCPQRPLRENLSLAGLARGIFGRWWWNRLGEERAARRAIEQWNIRCRGPEQPFGQLSGGNQQKSVLGRWLLTDPAVLILDEPTRGIDIGAKAEVHARLRQLANDGRAILLISSELPELLAHADSILVMRKGRLVGQFDSRSATPDELAAAALPADAAPATDSAATDPAIGRPANLETQSASRPAVAQAVGARRWAGILRAELALTVLVLLLSGWLTATSAGFSWTGLLTAASLWIVLGLAATVPILAGGIDISLGSLVGLAAAVAALVLQIRWPQAVTIPAAIGAGVAVGTLGGLANAGLALVGRVHPIVVTLGTLTIYRGLVLALLGRKAMTGLPTAFSRLAFDPGTGIRGTVIVAAGVALAMLAWIGWTRSGRAALAWGASPEAARLAGISHRRTWLVAFGLGGGLAGLAGVLQLAQSGQMQAQLGAGWELTAITVAVVGGVSISGGSGSVLGVVLAAILMRLVNSALVRWGVADDRADLLVGVLLLSAVLVDLGWRQSQRWRDE